MKQAVLREFLDCKFELYNNVAFIDEDPVSVPHRFKLLQDIEISGFFAALLSWGRRSTIIANSLRLMQLMDNAPYDFIQNHRPKDLKSFESFTHRTFNDTDLFYFISFLQEYYATFLSLESAFSTHVTEEDATVKNGLIGFRQIVFAGEHPARTTKHLSSPAKNSACKRMNMFLRWMVRSDHQGVDFGLWKRISPAQLIIPVDVHVSRVAKGLKLLDNDTVNWKNAEALTAELRKFDPNDPVKYDFALFGMGVMEKFG
jgi:uncharacterized protein (TIGR02757 family)